MSETKKGSTNEGTKFTVGLYEKTGVLSRQMRTQEASWFDPGPRGQVERPVRMDRGWSYVVEDFVRCDELRGKPAVSHLRSRVIRRCGYTQRSAHTGRVAGSSLRAKCRAPQKEPSLLAQLRGNSDVAIFDRATRSRSAVHSLDLRSGGCA